jgi:GNAT superfamily N-acetyltransferase
MNIKLLDIKDTKMLEDFLSPYKSQCMFICSNLKAAGIVYQGIKFQGEYWGCFNESFTQLKGIIVHYWNGNIMMFVPEPSTLKSLVATLKNNIKRPIAGVLGPNDQAELVIKELGISKEIYNINRNESLYELELRNIKETKLLPNSKIVSAKDISKDILINWMQDYEIEALGAQNSLELQKSAEVKANGLTKGDCWILMIDNNPVSLSAFNARIEGMVQVGPVWTPPKYRNQGFARMLLANTLIEEKTKGTNKAILFTDNPAAIRAYEAIGFKIMGDYRLALLKEPIHL